MSLYVLKKKKHGQIMFEAGKFYKFDYRGYNNDPTPVIIFINAIEGIHENTGHQWRIIQAINLSYVPRKDRIRFVEDWQLYSEKAHDIKFTWKLIERKYPYIKFAIRRYFTKPVYYINNLRILDTQEKIRKEVISSLAKDFSKKIKIELLKKIKKNYRDI